MKSASETKVIKRDNIVLGISDLKPHQKRFDSKNSSTTTTEKVLLNNHKSVVDINEEKINSNNNNNSNNNLKKQIIGNKQIVINPNDTIKVNNCEIVNRPRSVTAAIFTNTQKPSTPLKSELKEPTISSSNIKTRALSSTSKIFRQNPQNVTSKIFARRTEDMNKGFLMFSEDDAALTMLKDEPDDLTHLAPTAGDACIPLDEFSDMFDDFILPENYNTFVNDELNSLDSSCSKSTSSSSNSSCNDPFINYRDESSDVCQSPNLLSPGFSKSPDANSLPSLCSPGSLPEDELAFMTPNMEEEIDMSMRAPYISMSEASELPVLIAEDLMWGAQPDLKQSLNINRKCEVNLNNTITLAPLVLDDKSRQIPRNVSQTLQQQPQKSTMESSLATLLCSQLLQNQQREQHQQLHNHQQQQHQLQDQLLLNPSQEIKIKILDSDGTFSIVNSNTPSSSSIGSPTDTMTSDDTTSTIEWTMNDLLQLKSQPMRNDFDDSSSIETKSEKFVMRSKSNLSYKRPSISAECEQISSKRLKSQDSSADVGQQSNRYKSRMSCDDGGFTSSQKALMSPPSTQQQQSNSVLMNLLVNGCDVSAGHYTLLIPRQKAAKA